MDQSARQRFALLALAAYLPSIPQEHRERVKQLLTRSSGGSGKRSSLERWKNLERDEFAGPWLRNYVATVAIEDNERVYRRSLPDNFLGLQLPPGQRQIVRVPSILCPQ